MKKGEIRKESWINPKIEIKDSKIGKGMFAKESIGKNETVFIWGGNFILEDQLKNVTNKTKKVIIQVDDNLYSIEGRDNPEDSTYFINHSCDPNVWMKDSITFIARRKIKKGEELAVDYSMFVAEDYVSKWTCKCGSKLCRHKITGKDYLLPELQKRYRNHFSPVILKKIRGKFKKYVFKKYRKDYPRLFRLEKIKLLKVLGQIKIEHVGSTAVPGLGGKGIIDIAVLVSPNKFKESLNKLRLAGYEYRPFAGEDKRLFLQKYYPNKANPRKIFHIHLTISKKEFNLLIAFRDYLIKNPEEAEKYAKVKKKASLECNGVKERYWEIKGEVLNSILKKAGGEK